MARDKSDELRLAARDGRDARGTRVTFAQAFEQHFRQREQGLKNAKHIWQWRNGMENHAFPIIGTRSVAEITHDEIIAILRPIWREKPETARRQLQRMSTIFEIVISRGLRRDPNPCKGVADDLGQQGDRVAHHPALPYAEVPAFIRGLRTCNSNQMTKLAFEWLILTATRSGETRLADWAEIDEPRKIWVIPAERTKTKVQHEVPLSDRCLEILRSLPKTGLLFPARGGRPMSDMIFALVLKSMGLRGRASAHGFRSSFRDWATEVDKCREVVAEAALAHAVKDRAEAAYRRATYLDDRVGLMQRWANHCG